LQGGKSEKVTEVISVESASLFGAINLASTFISKDLTFIHNKAVVVSEELAREGLSRYINPLVRNRELRRTNYLLVAKGSASDFIEKNKELVFEKYPSRQMDLLMAASGFTGLTSRTDIHRFYQALKTPGIQPVAALVSAHKEEEKKTDEASKDEAKAKDSSKDETKKDGEKKDQGQKDEKQKAVEKKKEREQRSNEQKAEQEMAYFAGEVPRKGGNKVDVMGLAVFRSDKLVGFLDGEETRYYQMVSGHFKKGIFTFPDPVMPKSSIVVVEIKKGRSPDIKIKATPEKTTAQINIVLEGEILSIQSGKNYERGELEQKLQNYIRDYITMKVTSLIKKTQKEYKSDIFGIGTSSRSLFLTWDDWVNYKWVNVYPNVEVNVNTFFNIRRTGLMSKTAPTT
jgi:spore germination protein KC